MSGLGWELAAERQLAGDLVRPAILLRIATDPVIRLWAGIGDIELPADLIEDEDLAIYSGMGEFVSVPQVNALINGLAERVEFGLTGAGVTGPIAALASTEASKIRGAAVNLGFFIFGDTLAQLSPTAWLWDGIGDSLKVTRQPDDSGNAVRSIIISVGSLLTGRQRPSLGYWTDPDQRRRSADDAFCERVATYSEGTTIAWPI